MPGDKGVIIQSVDRAAAILNCFLPGELLSLTEIARRTGLKKTTAYGIVSTLHHNGMLDQNEENELYFLGTHLVILAGKVRYGVLEAARAHIDDVAERTHQTAYLAMQRGASVVCVSYGAENRAEAAELYHFGGLAPLYATAAGRAMLAYLPQKRLDKLLKSEAFLSRAENITAADRLLGEQLDEVRKIGYAFSFGEQIPNVASVAVPILNEDEISVGALCVAVHKDDAMPEQLMLYRDELIQHARMIERELRRNRRG